MTPLEALRAARTLLEDPSRWTRSAGARKRTARGDDPCPSTDPGATCWSAVGALGRVSSRRRGAPGVGELEEAARELFGEGIGRVNDRSETTHAMILACFDRAIARVAGHGARQEPVRRARA